MSIKNGDMPAMPLSGDAYQDYAYFDGTKNTSYNPQCQGLTKRETFAMNAPAMPRWFDVKFSIGEIDSSINIHMDETDLSELAFMAWPTYYADALLAQLEEKGE